jgi:fructose-bisphosphate aldolase, class I
MKSTNMNGILHNGRTLILACDQGFEHGPSDFNEKNIDPEYIMNIALEGRYNALAVQAGFAEKYHLRHYKDVPLIIKLNAKTRFDHKDPISLQHTSVNYAASLGARAVGYTIYLGSTQEQQMFKEFAQITEQAHQQGIPSICWMYPRGPSIQNDLDTDILAYGARIAMELGADMVKLKWNNDMNAMKWVVKSAGRTRVVIAGGSKRTDQEFIEMTKQAMEAGAIGMAIGRNVWQNEKPYEMTKALKDIIFKNATIDHSMGFFK